MRSSAVIRIRIITACVLAVSLLFIARLYYIQISSYETFVASAEQQYTHTVSDLYDRGSIFFVTKDGEKVSAATVQSGYLLAVDPSRITNTEETYTKLNAIVPIDRDGFEKGTADKTRPYFEVMKRVSEKDASQIEELKLPGVQLYRNQWRYYPGSALSARTVGFVGFSDNEGDSLVGRYGLERYYESVLSRDKNRPSINFFAEIFSNLSTIFSDQSLQKRGDVVTSIDPTVARMLDRELDKTHSRYQSALTGGIIIDPQTGEIYAMNAAPTFDLNDRSGLTINDFKNPLVDEVYEFGSIIKALTLAAGLDSQVITADSTYYDAGFLELDTFTIRNFDGVGRGTVDMQTVISQSLNTGVAHIVQQMGNKRFSEYFKALKIGNETGIDLPNETHGLIRNLESPRDVEYATASFGQGIALTPIAAVRALSALGNGGTLITPHLATRVEYEDGTTREITYPEGERVFSEVTSEEVSRMLTRVVDESLAGGSVKIPNYSVAAKTGTAQIAKPGGGYYDDRYLHSFFGYFPSYDPKYLVFLYTIEPKGVQYASETLTEPFMEITKFLINYYNVPPDR